MSEFTKAKRQEIVDEFATRHNGVYNPAVFLKEVAATGNTHPAYNWFEWNADKAAHEYNLWQARSFAKDLRITFQIEEVGREGAVKVKSVEMPAVLSPIAGRKDGGGYVLTDPNDPEHMAEHCRQAGAALRSWMRRYEAALIHIDGSTKTIERLASALEQSKATAEAA